MLPEVVEGGGESGLTYSLTGPAGGDLPDGLRFDANSRILSGMLGMVGTTTLTYTVTVDDTAPVFSSGATGGVVENSPITTVVYDAQATDTGGAIDAGITYTLGGADAAAFNIDGATGEVRLNATADFETKAGYARR